jgi:GH15 family glucan-1,4-alpha-glucosidase
LLLLLLNFLSVDDPRIAATISAVEYEHVREELVRYKKPHDSDPQGGVYRMHPLIGGLPK